MFLCGFKNDSLEKENGPDYRTIFKFTNRLVDKSILFMLHVRALLRFVFLHDGGEDGAPVLRVGDDADRLLQVRVVFQ